MPDVEYMLFCCRDVEDACGFIVQAKTTEETMKHAKAYMESEHGMKEISRGTERKIGESIKPVKAEE